MKKENRIWKKEKPMEVGAYWVRGFNTFLAKRQQVEALVEVRVMHRKLICNIHEKNSNKEYRDWFLLEALHHDLEWCGPLTQK